MSCEEKLAIAGGVPVRTAPLPRWPVYAEDEIAAVTDVLKSGKVNYWTGGEVAEFENAFAGFCGRRHALALTNGTAALELALRAFGITDGEVIVPCRTFVASATAAMLAGATPVFADVDLQSGNLTADTLRPLLGEKTRAAIAVHLAGWPCDMDPIMELARERGLIVIEDCAQAHGATYRGRPVGSRGHAAAFSFCQDKIVSTGGEGGLLTLDDDAAWRRAWSYKDHGKDYDRAKTPAHEGSYRYVHSGIGTNWRMTGMQAAIGIRQLAKLTDWVAARRLRARELDRAFGAIPALRVATPGEDFGHAYYRYYVYVRPERLKAGWDRNKIIAAINAEGVTVRSGICPDVSREPVFGPCERGGRHENAAALGETSLAFFVDPCLSDRDIADTIAATAKVLLAAGAAS